MPFSQPIGLALSTLTATTGGNVLVNSTVAVPGAYYICKDTSSFKSIVFTWRYFGNPVYPAGTGDLLQATILWYTDTTLQTLLWVDTLEFNSDYNPDYTDKRAQTTVRVMGQVCVVSFNGGTGGAANPTCAVYALGSNREVDKNIFGNDQIAFSNTDLFVLRKSGGAIASGGSVLAMFGGLASGPAYFSGSVAWTTGAANVGQLRFRFGFGSTGFGLPDTFVTQTGVGVGLAASTSIDGFYLPRRPIIVSLLDTGSAVHNTVTSWNFNIVRDEP